MPFKSDSAMEKKQSFIRDYLTGQYTFNSLCVAYGISRRGGYDLVKRFESDPNDFHLPRSRRPLNSPLSTSDFLVAKIVFWRTRKKKNRWGAKKIHAKLLELNPDLVIPSVTTIHNILVKKGLVKPRRKRRLVVSQNLKFEPDYCNEIWSIDHKGKFYLGNKKRCSPLTVCDSWSRFIFKIKGQYRETWRGVKNELIPIFREFGQPEYLHSDNGSAFASIQSSRGFGSLSYWLLDHGIIPLFSDPGRPTQNGRHERMHKDLKAECCDPASYDLRVQNREMNAFSKEFNYVRPHESLGQRKPGDVHELSTRRYSENVSDPEYDTDMIVRRITASGTIRWKSYEYVTVSRALKGKYVGLKQLGNRVYSVYYRDEELGYFQEGETIQYGHYYMLRSDDDMPQRWRDRQQRRRK